MPKFKYPKQYDDEFLNTFKSVLDYLSSMGYTYEESLQMARNILNEAKKTNSINTEVNKRLDKIIADSGTSSTEVIDARGDAPVLGNRMNNHENQIIETDYVEILKNKMYFSEMSLIKTHDAGMQQFDVYLKNSKDKIRMTFAKPDDYFKLSTVSMFSTEYSPTSEYVGVSDLSYTGDWFIGTGGQINFAQSTNASASHDFNLNGVTDISFRHFADNRGGLMRFTLDNANPVTISTYAITAGNVVDVIYKDIPPGPHVLKVDFIGDDPDNPPSGGVGTSRGWLLGTTISGDPVFVYDIVGEEESQNPETVLMSQTSNKEYAFSLAPLDSTNFQWIPQHATQTAINRTAPIFVLDGVEYSISDLNIGEEISFKDFKYIQDVYGRNPDSGTQNLVNVKTIHSINLDGTISVDGAMDVLKSIQIASSYVMMTPVNNKLFNVLQTGWGTQYPMTKSDNTTTTLNEDANCGNYIFLSTENDYFVAYKHSDRRGNFNVNGSATKKYHNFVQHRDADLMKHYINIYDNQVLPAGYKHRWSGVYIVGKIRNIYELMSSR